MAKCRELVNLILRRCKDVNDRVFKRFVSMPILKEELPSSLKTLKQCWHSRIKLLCSCRFNSCAKVILPQGNRDQCWRCSNLDQTSCRSMHWETITRPISGSISRTSWFAKVRRRRVSRSRELQKLFTFPWFPCSAAESQTFASDCEPITQVKTALLRATLWIDYRSKNGLLKATNWPIGYATCLALNLTIVVSVTSRLW